MDGKEYEMTDDKSIIPVQPHKVYTVGDGDTTIANPTWDEFVVHIETDTTSLDEALEELKKRFEFASDRIETIARQETFRAYQASGDNHYAFWDMLRRKGRR